MEELMTHFLPLVTEHRGCKSAGPKPPFHTGKKIILLSCLCSWAFYTYYLQHTLARKLSIGWFRPTQLEQPDIRRQKVNRGGGETGLF